MLLRDLAIYGTFHIWKAMCVRELHGEGVIRLSYSVSLRRPANPRGVRILKGYDALVHWSAKPRYV